MAESARPGALKRLLFHPLEAVLLSAAFRLTGALSLDAASTMGGRIARTLGPLHPANRRILANLDLALPELDAEERLRLVREVWENVGRIAAEYPHLSRIADPTGGRLELAGIDRLLDLARARQPAVLASAHLANFELLPVAAARLGIDLLSVVRDPNNPRVRAIVEHVRGGGRRARKGPTGARLAIEQLKRGGMVGLLADQKLNDGVEARFFGQPAMTAAAPAQLALRFGCPLIPVRVERLEGARFRLVCEEPMPRPAAADRQAAILELTQALNDRIESWVRERPEQWFWLHRRWPRGFYRKPVRRS